MSPIRPVRRAVTAASSAASPVSPRAAARDRGVGEVEHLVVDGERPRGGGCAGAGGGACPPASRGRGVERLRRGRAPVHQQRLVVVLLVEQADPADVAPLPGVGVEPAEAPGRARRRAARRAGRCTSPRRRRARSGPAGCRRSRRAAPTRAAARCRRGVRRGGRRASRRSGARARARRRSRRRGRRSRGAEVVGRCSVGAEFGTVRRTGLGGTPGGSTFGPEDVEEDVDQAERRLPSPTCRAGTYEPTSGGVFRPGDRG